jgi:hypothetical protein
VALGPDHGARSDPIRRTDPEDSGTGFDGDDLATTNRNEITAVIEHEEFTKVRNILKIELGRHEMDTWYFSPFPPEYNDCSKLYFCEVRAGLWTATTHSALAVEPCR